MEEVIDAIRSEGFPVYNASTFSAHQMGTCRMGSDPTRSVVGPTGECWECKGLFVADASVFPTSSGSNPMVTTLSIAHAMAQEMRKGMRAEAAASSAGGMADQAASVKKKTMIAMSKM